MKTSRLERQIGLLADEYMAHHPGVTRQEAKRRVGPRAQFAISAQDLNKAREEFVLRMRPVFTNFADAMSRIRGGL